MLSSNHGRQRASGSGLFTNLNDLGRLARLLAQSDKANPRTLLARWRGDIFGGTVAALIAVPYGMALAVAIGLRPEAGLYTSMIGGAVYGLFSSSPIMISGLSATAVPILAEIVKTHGVAGALAVGFLSGLFMLIIGVLRLGRFANYLPQSIISAFTSGLGLIIVASQLKSAFGVTPVKMGFDLGIVDDVTGVLGGIGSINPQAIVVASLVIVAMVVLRRWKENIPSSLIGVLLSSLVAWSMGFELPRVGSLSEGFPTPRLPDLDLSILSSLIHPALTLAGLFTINQVLTGIIVGRIDKSEASHRSNQELIAQGAANLVNPFFGAPPGVAMLARSVASARAGAMSRVSIIAHSLVLLLFLVPLRSLVSHIPVSALAAVTVVVGFQLIDWKRFTAFRRMSRTDVWLFLLTFSLVVLSDLIIGVGIGFLLAMILFIEHAADSTYLETVDRPQDVLPIKIEEQQAYRLIGPLFFASSEKVLSQLKTEPTTKILILDLEATGPIDSTAADLFRKVFQMQRSRGGNLYLTNLDQRLYSMFERDGLIAEMGTSCFTFKTATPSSAANNHVHFNNLRRSKNQL